MVDPGDGSFSGDNLAFIYPDLLTVFVGKFVGGRMVAGHPAKVSNVTYNSHGIAVCKYMVSADFLIILEVEYTKVEFGNGPYAFSYLV